MRLEPFVFLGIVLTVWLISAFGSWLRQELERRSTDVQDGLPTVEGVPSAAVVAVDGAATDAITAPVVPETVTRRRWDRPAISSPSPPPPRVAEPAKRPCHVRSCLRYRYPKALRDGIVMMTVFGPCKGLDSQKTFWPREYP